MTKPAGPGGGFPSSSNPDIFICEEPPLKNENGQEIQNFAQYMDLKRRKLLRQVHRGIVSKSNIFAGVSIYVNGYTVPPASTLRQLIVANGGQYHHYFTAKQTTHMVASTISSSRWNALARGAVVIRPEWIVESIKAGTRKAVAEYLLRPPTRPNGSKNNKIGCNVASCDPQQLLITEFGHRRRNAQREKPPKSEKEEKMREEEGATGADTEQPENRPTIGLVKKRREVTATKKIFTYGLKENEPGMLFIGSVAIDYTKELADAEMITRLKGIFRSLLNQSEFGAARASMRFLDRVLHSTANVHRDWPLIYVKLTRWINEHCEKRYQARLIPERAPNFVANS